MSFLQDYLLTNAKFTPFNREHCLWLLFAVLYCTFWIFLGKKATTLGEKKRIALIFSWISIVVWALMTFAHYIYEPAPRISTLLPFHLCYFLNLFLVLIHYYHSAKIFDYWYPWVMAVCVQALFTADLEEAFPHYYNLRYFIVHITLVLHMIYALVIYGFRPDKWTPIRAILVGNIYFWSVHLLNLWLNTNFMYTIENPPGTILDALGSNSLLKAQILAVVLFYVVTVPFLFWEKEKN